MNNINLSVGMEWMAQHKSTSLQDFQVDVRVNVL